MALKIADVRARVETDLDDEALQRALDANVKSVDRSAGKADSHTDSFPCAIGAPFVGLTRRPQSITEIIERRTRFSDPVTLSPDDFRIVDDVRVLRLPDGTNPGSHWGMEVTVEYVPEVDSELRDEVTLRLIEIDVEAGAYDSENVGDWSGSTDWKKRRKTELSRVREGRSPLL